MKIHAIYAPRLSGTIKTWSALIAIFTLLTACATSAPTQSFDYGSAPFTIGLPKLQLTGMKWVVAEIRVPASLDGNAMLYRLNYENPQELKPYAQSRWSVSPAQLLSIRLKQAINQAGGAALSAADGIKDTAQLRIELEEFAQHFSAPQHSQARLHLRVGLIHKNTLIAQRAFTADVDAGTPDAKGGAAAMVRASDQIIQQMLQWAQQEQQSAKMQ